MFSGLLRHFIKTKTHIWHIHVLERVGWVVWTHGRWWTRQQAQVFVGCQNLLCIVFHCLVHCQIWRVECESKCGFKCWRFCWMARVQLLNTGWGKEAFRIAQPSNTKCCKLHVKCWFVFCLQVPSHYIKVSSKKWQLSPMEELCKRDEMDHKVGWGTEQL